MSTGERAISEALLYDGLHFTGTGIVTFTAALDGTLGQQVNATSPEYVLAETFSLAGASGCWGSQLGVGFGPCGSQNFGFLTSSFGTQTASGFNFTGTFAVTSGQSTTFLATLMADCGFGSLCDFSHTATFSFTGVSYTEDSGVLFSQPLTATPEPGTLGLLGTGLLVVGALGRRGARRSARIRGEQLRPESASGGPAGSSLAQVGARQKTLHTFTQIKCRSQARASMPVHIDFLTAASDPYPPIPRHAPFCPTASSWRSAANQIFSRRSWKEIPRIHG
jgi:hypothetical protein